MIKVNDRMIEVKHIDELRIYMNDQQLDILAINESRLDLNVSVDLVSIQGYIWISNNRNRRGGGIGFYLRNTINHCIRQDLSNDEIEVLTVEIRKYKIKPFLITTWYRPPNSKIEIIKAFEKFLLQIDTED